jgi:DNA end-binding protein Ku
MQLVLIFISVFIRYIKQIVEGLGIKKVCEKDGEELKPDDIIKAYIVGDECLKFTDEELDVLKPFATKIMEILGFCKLEEIPVEALNKSYYIGTDSPQKGGTGKSFLLLKESLIKSDKVAVVKWVSRTNEYLGMIQPLGKGLLLKQLLYHEQVRPIDEVEILESDVSDELVNKGVKAVEKMAFNFDWTNYTETYTQEVKELVEKKFLGEEVEVSKFKLPETRSIEAELEKMLEE